MYDAVSIADTSGICFISRLNPLVRGHLKPGVTLKNAIECDFVPNPSPDGC
jgi:hypothetical protein